MLDRLLPCAWHQHKSTISHTLSCCEPLWENADCHYTVQPRSCLLRGLATRLSHPHFAYIYGPWDAVARTFFGRGKTRLRALYFRRARTPKEWTPINASKPLECGPSTGETSPSKYMLATCTGMVQPASFRFPAHLKKPHCFTIWSPKFKGAPLRQRARNAPTFNVQTNLPKTTCLATRLCFV